MNPTTEAAIKQAEESAEQDIIIGRSATPKDYPEDYQLENGTYQNRCTSCRELFYGHKRRITCKQCAVEPTTDSAGRSEPVARSETEATAQESTQPRHLWNGNCLDWPAEKCFGHNQPRGECSKCLPCPACKQALEQPAESAKPNMDLLDILDQIIPCVDAEDCFPSYANPLCNHDKACPAFYRKQVAEALAPYLVVEQPAPTAEEEAGKAASRRDMSADAIQQRAIRAREIVWDLCHGERWRMSIPVQSTDPDVILDEALRDLDYLVYIVRHEDAPSIDPLSLSAGQRQVAESLALLLDNVNSSWLDQRIQHDDVNQPTRRWTLRAALKLLGGIEEREVER